MNSMTGGEAVYRQLSACGVTAAFGVIGGSMLELYDSIHRGGEIRYIGARDERSAGLMADAYARVRGGPGVALAAQAGPGVANFATAVAEAHLAYSPLVVIAGAIQRSDLGKDTFQEIDQVSIFARISKLSKLVEEPEELPRAIVEAIDLSMTGRRGPVVLHVPRDLFSASLDNPEICGFKPPRPLPPSADSMRNAMRMIGKAVRPVIVAGGGLKWSEAAADLRKLAEQMNVPVVASTGHADLMPHGHPLFAGQSGPRGNRVAARLTKEADLLLALGTRLGFNSTFLSREYVGRDAKIIQVDIEPSAIGKYFPAELGIVADAGAAARAISAEFSQPIERWTKWTCEFQIERAQLDRERALEANNGAVPMHPTRALAEIRTALPRDAIVTIDTGNSCLQAADRLAHCQCPGLIAPLDFGLVGFGYAAAIGAQVAAPHRPVVAVIGDGGFGYAMAEVMTAVQYGLPVVAVILDNKAWGAEKAYQLEFFGGRALGADLEHPDFDRFAELCGAAGRRVSEPGQLGPALTDALARKQPAIIHVDIDPTAVKALRKDLFDPKSGHSGNQRN